MNHDFSPKAKIKKTGFVAFGIGLLSTSAYAASLEFRSAHSELMSDSTYSFDYVVPEVPKVRPPPSDNWFLRLLGEIFGALGTVLVWLFWAGIIAIAAAILFYIAKEAVRLQRAKNPKVKSEAKVVQAPAYTPDASAARLLLSDVDALAAAGKYDEAVHTLLLRSIEDIKVNNPRAVARDLTGREISALPILSDTARTVFSGISQRVERSLFGGRKLSLEDFKICREAYEGFAFETNPKRRRR